MRISQLAKDAGVGVETVRYYQRIGLLQTPARPLGGIRTYRQSDVDRLRFIRRAQQLGLSLDDVAGMLQLSSRDCADAQAIAYRKLALVREKLVDLARVERALVQVLDRCRTRAPNDDCPVIAALSGPDGAGRSSFICVMGRTDLPSPPVGSRAAAGAKPTRAARRSKPAVSGKEST